jgi:hypothetical protein
MDLKKCPVFALFVNTPLQYADCQVVARLRDLPLLQYTIA